MPKQSGGYTETYAYDAIVNMTAKTADGVKTQYKYNAGNQLTESVTGAETTKYSYDKVGNLVKKDGAGDRIETADFLHVTPRLSPKRFSVEK